MWARKPASASQGYPFLQSQEAFSLLTDYPMVTCGTLPAPMDLPSDRRSGCVGHECPPNLLPGGPGAGFQAPSATAVTYHRIIEAFRLEKTFEIIESNRKPNAAKSTTKPRP